jgi:hypothetical protein
MRLPSYALGFLVPCLLTLTPSAGYVTHFPSSEGRNDSDIESVRNELEVEKRVEFPLLVITGSRTTNTHRQQEHLPLFNKGVFV